MAISGEPVVWEPAQANYHQADTVAVWPQNNNSRQ